MLLNSACLVIYVHLKRALLLAFQEEGNKALSNKGELK